MHELTAKELEEIGGAFSCTLNPAPINWAAVGVGALTGFAVRGGGPYGAALGAAGAFLNDRWTCKF
jgi:hypothetical protein